MYQEKLEIAVAAALEAGALLREEQHRPGGPRGADSHADVDSEVEAIIKTRLRNAFPDWGYLGEETGPGSFPPGAPYWAVDPNDGTTWFLRGLRGSAVSIGLIRDGLPVLGVVYSFAAPDDQGDLFTWAEGLPLFRNGRLVPPMVPPSKGEEFYLLHSPAIRNNPSANEELSKPGLVRALPSIAYRLALTSSGDGHVAISLNAPTTWDVAGGHALLLGAGGDLWNEHGERIRYGLRGEMPSGRFVFGGLEDVVGRFRRRPWADVLR
jgi:fructose-1,6-bisphosphatase/inositol monophosphatase family enzyme